MQGLGFRGLGFRDLGFRGLITGNDTLHMTAHVGLGCGSLCKCTHPYVNMYLWKPFYHIY